MKNILVVMPMEEHQKRYIESIAGENPVRYSSYAEVTQAEVDAADVVIGNASPALIANAPHIEWMQLNSAGFDPYCKPGVIKPGTVLTCATGAYGLAVSEGMLTMSMMLCRKMDLYAKNQHERLWRKEGDITSIYGSTTLILGLGDIGQEYAKRMHALGSHVIGIRRKVNDKPDFIDELYTMDKLDELLPRADFVAMILPSSPTTHHLMDERRLKLMKKGAYLINAGRGDAVDCMALDRVLREGGYLGGAALDVTEPEPLPAEHPLWDAPRCIILPHAAGNFFLPETVERIVRIAGSNLEKFLAGDKESMRNIINTEKCDRV